jgi:hypothetical protein
MNQGLVSRVLTEMICADAVAGTAKAAASQSPLI